MKIFNVFFLRFSLVLLILFGAVHNKSVFGQEVFRYVISASGGESDFNGLQMNSNIGELFANSLNGGGLVFTQGFLQPEIYTVSVPEENPIAVSVFPNPFAASFTILLNGMHEGYVVQLTDLSGKVIVSQNISPGVQSTFMDVPVLASGYYFLQLTPLNLGPVLHYKLVHL